MTDSRARPLLGPENSLRAWSDDLRVAVALLTRIPVSHPDGPMPSYVGRALRAFPLVGALIGACIGLVDLALLALHVPAGAAAALALGAGVLLTGALHEDGLADVGDGFVGGVDKATKLDIMRDSRLGTFGGLTLVVSFTAKACALAALSPAAVLPALVVAHALGRAAIPVLSVKLPPARMDGLGVRVGTPPRAIAVTAGALALAVTLLMLPVREAVLAAVLAAGATAAVGLLAMRQIGGQTGDVLGAGDHAVEIAVLVACAARFG